MLSFRMPDLPSALPVLLMAGILIVGLAPFWLNDPIGPTTTIITEQLGALDVTGVARRGS